ncbi:MAG: transposase [Cyanophyceae cyanobacterium]
MSPRKLTESNKQEILSLYRGSPETTSTLAERYEVSSSTISRFLKSNLSAAEYEDLIQQKRLGRTANRSEKPAQSQPQPLEAQASFPPPPAAAESPKPKPKKSRLPDGNASEDPKPKPKKTIPPIPERENLTQDRELGDSANDEVNVATLQAMLGEDLADLEEDELDESEEDWEDELEAHISTVSEQAAALQILPLSAASFPRTCYLVIDRGADLITRPLKDFAELGSIPVAEVQQKTLPVFDNQRVARRFSNRSQRVIKVPDGQILERTSPYLEAKGITRLLMDGKVYALSASTDDEVGLRN